MTDFSPREIVSELDRYIIGQNDAKRAVAIALRNRWRRLQLDDKLREEVLPKNILMIGPTGVGKTEISRRLAKLAGAPFLKVEATKFTEVGYVGRDVEQIVRDLVEIAHRADARAQAQGRAGARRIWRPRSACSTRWSARTPAPATKRIVPPQAARRRARRQGDRDRACSSSGGGMPMFEIPGMPGAQMGAISIGDMFGKAMRRPHQDAGASPWRESLRPADRGGIRQAARQDQLVQEAIQRGREQRHRVPRRDRQDLRARGPRAAPTSRARACSATCCR